MPQKPCIECGVLSNRTRCPAHEANLQANKRARRASAPGDGSAKMLRKALNETRRGVCNECKYSFDATELEIDHVTPLSVKDSPGDVATNIQILCIEHHKEKTALEATARSK